jgi:hypothetical protein
MKSIIKFATFDTNEEFTAWQVEKMPNIYNIVPIPITIDIEQSNTESISANGVIKIKIFVTYFES